MGLSDIIGGLRGREERVVLALAGTLLTRQQIRILAEIASNAQPDALEAAILATQPRGARGGPLLPYLAMGDLDQFPLFIDDLVKVIIAYYAAVGDDIKSFSNRIPTILQGEGGVIAVGAQHFYASSDAFRAADVNTPFHLRQRTSTVSMAAVLAWQGIDVEGLGTGFIGASPLKGNLEGGVHAGSLGPNPTRTPAPDAATTAAARAAQGLMEPVK